MKATAKLSQRRPRKGATRVYVSYDGYLPSDRPLYTLKDPAFKRAKRADCALLRGAILALLPGLGPLHYSAHAGCGVCPCSPGFISRSAKGEDIWLDVTLTPEPGDRDPMEGGREDNREARDAEMAREQGQGQAAR